MPSPATATSPDPADKPLTARQQRFVDLLLHEDNAAEAARRAGYRPLAAKHTAHKLLARPNIQAALKASQAGAEGPLSREAVMEELRAIAFANMLDLVAIGQGGRLDLDLSKITRAQAAGFRELTIDETWNRNSGNHRRQVRVRMGAKIVALSRLLVALERLEAETAQTGTSARRGPGPLSPDRRATKDSAKGDRKATRSPPSGDRRSEAGC